MVHPNGFNGIELGGCVHRHHLGHPGSHAEPGHAAFALATECRVCRSFIAEAVEVDPMASGFSDAGGSQPIELNRGAVHHHVVTAQGGGGGGVVPDIDTGEVHARIVEPLHHVPALCLVAIADGDPVAAGEPHQVKRRLAADTPRPA